jgi:hypothetical protein
LSSVPGAETPSGDRADDEANPRPRREVWLPIAGGAQTPLDHLKDAEYRLGRIVRRWRNPERVTLANFSSSERLVLRIYEIVEDELAQAPGMLEAYNGVRPGLSRRYEETIDAIARFKRVLIADRDRAEAARLGLPDVRVDADALVGERRTMINAVNSLRQ